jgi:hypothetical protein
VRTAPIPATLFVVAALTLAGCGGNDDQQTEAPSTSTTTSTTTTTAAPTTTSGPAGLAVEEALTIARREFPELEALDTETALQMVRAACVRRGSGATTEGVWADLAELLQQRPLSEGAIAKVRDVLDAGMQVNCPGFAPTP